MRRKPLLIEKSGLDQAPPKVAAREVEGGLVGGRREAVFVC